MSVLQDAAEEMHDFVSNFHLSQQQASPAGGGASGGDGRRKRKSSPIAALDEVRFLGLILPGQMHTTLE